MYLCIVFYLTCMYIYVVQLDLCMQEKAFESVDNFHKLADKKAGTVDEETALIFLEVSKQCTQNNHKRRCSMDDVSDHTTLVLDNINIDGLYCRSFTCGLDLLLISSRNIYYIVFAAGILAMFIILLS